MSTNPNPPALSTDERVQQLERQVAEILALLRQPKAQENSTTPTEKTSSPTPEPNAPFVSRRSMLKQAAMATLGVAAVLETMPSAKATDNSALLVGEANTSTTSTQLSSSYGLGPCFSAVNTATVANGSSAASGVSGSSMSGYGVSGSSSSEDYAGVVGTTFGNNGIGVFGITSASSAYGVAGVSVHYVGVSGSGGTIGVSGVVGSDTGSAGTGYGLSGVANGYGASLSGVLAPLILVVNQNGVINPNFDTNVHMHGELFVDTSGGLWYCTVAGTPGTWRKMADSGTAGSFALLSAPTRFIDTRPRSASYTGTGAPPAGSVGTFFYRFTGMNALAPYTPMGTTAPVIPFGATGLVGRITVLSGESGSAVGGQLKVSNVSPPGFGSGLVIWGTTTATQIFPFALPLNNTSVSGSGVMYFENTSASDAIDLIVDVTGYYY